MIILDTSVVIPLVRKGGAALTGKRAESVGDADLFLTAFTELELMQGARDEVEWKRLELFLSGQDLLGPSPGTWRKAARCYFELRRVGVTIGSVLDCCIAEIAIERDSLLFHNDRDFERIADVRPLKHRRLDISQDPS